MQNPIQKFRQSSFVFEKPGISRNELQLPYSSIFFAEILHTFPTYQRLQKRLRDVFYFVQILSYFQKLRRPGFYTVVFYIFIHTSRSKQNKKNSKHYFLDIIKQRTCAKFQQKKLNSMVVGTCQIFQFFRQKTWFLGNNSLNLGIGLCIT